MAKLPGGFAGRGEVGRCVRTSVSARWRGVLIVAAAMIGSLCRPSVAAAQDAEAARAVMRRAEVASADADSARAVGEAWRLRLQRAPDDRLAAFGLAVLGASSGRGNTEDGALRALLPATSQAEATDDAVARYARLELGKTLASEGRWLDAAQVLSTAAAEGRLAHDSTLEATAILHLVPLLSRWRDPGVEGRLARADSIIPPAALGLRADAQCARAVALAAQHRPGALEAADTGAALAQRASDARAHAACVFTTATILALRGDVDSATPRLRAAIDETTTTHEYRFRATIRQWLGYELLTLGHFGDALAVLRQSSEEGRAFGNLAAVGWSELNLAALFDRVGDQVGARRHILRGREALSASRDSSGLGILGRIDGDVALALGDTATARTRGTEALHAAQQTGRAPDIIAALTVLAVVDVHEQQWHEALAELSAARQVAATYHVPQWVPSVAAVEGRVLLDAGQPRQALVVLRDAFRSFDSTQHLYRYGLREAIADAQLHLGDTTGAVDALIRANRLVDAWRATLSDADVRVLAFQATDLTGEVDAGYADVIAAAALSGRMTTAFALTEWRRARELIDQINRASALQPSDGPAASSAPSPIPVRGPGSPANREGASEASNGVSVTLSGLQRAIPDDSTAVLEYVAGPARVPTTILVVTRRQAFAREIPPAASLADEIERLDARIEDNVSAEAAARVLGDRVIQPAIADLPARIVRLVIVPDGALHRIPFAALLMHDGRPLVERFAISLAPSATVVATLWHRPKVIREATILAFGDPVQPSEAVLAGRIGERGADASVDSSGAAAPPSRLVDSTAVDTNAALDRDAAAALDATGALPRLLWTADEARLVGEFSTQSMVRLRGDASAAYLQSTPLDRYTVLHFATHSVVDDVTPTRSALVLAPGGGRTGFVGPADLQALHLTADLVVLSACRSARGAVVAGEGVRGLTAPLLAAGARSVLATQWRLDDRAAVPLVYAIYHGLAAGLPLADAVQHAEVAARQRGAPVREWAVFTAVGDGTVRVPLHMPRPDHVPAWLNRGE